MKGMFSFNNPLFTFLGHVFDMIALSLMWLVCCIPVVTIVPATAALYFTVWKIASKEDPTISQTFFRSFRANLRQGILLSIFFLLSILLLYLDHQYYLMQSGLISDVMRVLFFMFLILFVMIWSFVLPLLAKFDNTPKQTVKNAVILTVRHPLRAAVVAIIHALPFCIPVLLPELSMKLLPAWVMLLPSVSVYLNTIVLRQILSPYLSSEDELPEKKCDFRE